MSEQTLRVGFPPAIAYEFEQGIGRIIDERGKPHWPNHLTVHLNRERALRVIQEIAAQLGNEAKTEVTISLEGQFVRYEEVSNV